MRILLDTHTLIWALFDDKRLSERARVLIENMHNDIFYSAASIWEIQIKHGKNPNVINFDGNDIMRFCDDAGYHALNVCGFHACRIDGLKIKEGCTVSNDPFDRLLLAQAKHECMLFLTHDKSMQYYDEPSVFMF